MAISGAVLIGGILAVGIGVAISQFGKSPKDEAKKLEEVIAVTVADQVDVAQQVVEAQANLDLAEGEGLGGADLSQLEAKVDDALVAQAVVTDMDIDAIENAVTLVIEASNQRQDEVEVALVYAATAPEIQRIQDEEAAALTKNLAAMRRADEQLRLLARPMVKAPSGEMVRSNVYQAAPGEPINRPKTLAQLFPDAGTGPFDDLSDLRKLQELALHSSQNRIHDPQYGFGTKYTLRVANAIMAIARSGVVVPNDWEEEGTALQTAAHTTAVILSQMPDWKGYEQHLAAVSEDDD